MLSIYVIEMQVLGHIRGPTRSVQMLYIYRRCDTRPGYMQMSDSNFSQTLFSEIHDVHIQLIVLVDELL